MRWTVAYTVHGGAQDAMRDAYQRAYSAVLYGVVAPPGAPGQATGVTKDEALQYAADFFEAAKAASIVHACPPDGSGVTPCCGRTPLELPAHHQLTVNHTAVTCPGEEQP